MTKLVLPTSGEIFDGRYELFEELGGGGMGCVYRARDTRADRPVALKIVRPDEGGYTDDTRARFAREVRIIANLSGPHTVKFYDFGTSDIGLLYMVFEYVPGRDLSSLIQGAGRLDPGTTVHILKQVLESLREAHDAGLMHRDIKPDNIRVHDESDGLHVKLLDFGIARQITRGSGDSITRAGELIGTPRYMSPEQLTERELTPASDIYSLGIVAFEMLMGADAVQGNRWGDQVDRLATGYVFSIPEIERVGAPLAAIIGRMSARVPEDRYQSVGAVVAALKTLNSSPSPLPTVRASSVPRLTTRRRIAKKMAEIPSWMWVAFVLVAISLGVALSKFRASKPPLIVAPPSSNRSALLKRAVEGPIPTPDAGTDALAAVDRGRTDTGPADPCSRPAPFHGLGNLSDTATGEKWLSYIPKDYQPGRRRPMIIALNQDGQTPRELLRETQLPELAERVGAILVAPRTVTVLAWDLPKVAHVTRSMEAAKQQLCVDPSRIFAFGHGPGGRVVLALACSRSDIAAVATSSYQQFLRTPLCKGFERIPYLSLVPLHDGNVPPEGGDGCSAIRKLSLRDHEEQFMQRNSCKGTRRVAREEDDGVCYTWDCDAELVSCHIDGGRGWPNAPSSRRLDLVDCDGKPANFPYQDVMWDFFERAGDARAKAGK